VGRAGILQLALCAVDVALWDLFAKVREAPLWQVFGTPARKSVAAYNTDVGWLSFSDDELVDNVSRAVDQGFTAVKMKVGGPRLSEDILRCTKVREAVGPTVIVATDANGKWDLPTALRFARESADLDLFWVEEPLWYDDVESHVELARQAVLQIALGEQIYTPQGMSQFIRRKAVHYVQPDVTRIGGVSGFLQAASYAEGAGLPIAAHAGDMSQVHVHMAYALANHTMLEYIPWIAHAFREPARVVHGEFERPSQPGASTTPTDEAFAEYRVD
jgi:L-alanine-DL-glutamate epimerase-like enolase superfamily enzyme